jgi:hypothetical protein
MRQKLTFGPSGLQSSIKLTLVIFFKLPVQIGWVCETNSTTTCHPKVGVGADIKRRKAYPFSHPHPNPPGNGTFWNVSDIVIRNV